MQLRHQEFKMDDMSFKMTDIDWLSVKVKEKIIAKKDSENKGHT